jgi:predicted hydrolase (HD superfamily)
MTRDQAYSILIKYLQNKNLLKHCRACEVAMQAIYRSLTPESERNAADEEKWGITGLMHDADYELAQNTNQLEKHGLLLFEKEPDSIPDDIAHAIKAHNYENTGVNPETPMDWGIACVDQLTGLIVAAALVHPDKKLASVTTESVLKRFKEKSFARGARREAILLCEEKLGIPLKDFVALTLEAMQHIAPEMGL